MNLLKGFQANKKVIGKALLAGGISIVFDIAKGIITNKVNPSVDVVEPVAEEVVATTNEVVENISNADLVTETEG